MTDLNDLSDFELDSQRQGLRTFRAATIADARAVVKIEDDLGEIMKKLDKIDSIIAERYRSR